MIKILLLFIIFASISPSSIPTLDFGVETDFNEGTHEFNIDSSTNKTMIVAYIDIEDKQLKFHYSSTAGDKAIIKEITINSPGGGVMLRLLPEATNFLTFASLDGREIKGGKIWIYPLDETFYVDESAKINKKYTIYYETDASEEFNFKSFDYYVENSGEDKTLIFTYEKNFKDESIEFNNMEFPFDLCVLSLICFDIPNIFPFLAHEQCTFSVKFEKRTVGDKLYYILPAHSFSTLIPKKIEYDVEMPFKKDNNIFRLENTTDHPILLTYVSTDNKILNSTYCSKNPRFNFLYGSHDFKSPGGGWVLRTKADSYISLELASPEGDEKGEIWIHPLNENITIDLSKKIEKKITFESYDMFDPLTYSVSNLAMDRKVKFNYQKEYKDDKGETIKLSNPFMVCKDEDCQENVESYEFKKGENYTISVKFLNQTGRYFLPAFSFYSNAGFLSLSLIYLALLLIL